MTCNGEPWGIWSKGGAGFKGRKGLLVTGRAGLEREGRKPQGWRCPLSRAVLSDRNIMPSPCVIYNCLIAH